MVVVKFRCDTCQAQLVIPITAMHALVCKDDEALNRYGFPCPTCGPQLNVMNRHEFHALDADGIVTCYYTRSEVLADLRREHAALIREWSERLPEVLEQILSAEDAA